MKKVFAATFFTLLTVCTFAQTGSKKEIKKEVNVQVENGEKTVTVTTTENGVATQEVFKGEAAEKKIQEIENTTLKLQEEAAKNPNKTVIVEKETVNSNGVKEEQSISEIRMEEINGEKILIIKSKVNGEERVEKYKGAEADKKMQEMQNDKSGKYKKEVRKNERNEIIQD